MKHTLKHLYDSQLKFMRNTYPQFYQKQFDNAFNLYSKDLRAHFSCVNAIEFSNQESEHFVSGGDDRRVLVWNLDKDVLSAQDGRKCSPKTLKSYHQSNISTLAWDNENKRIFSGGNDSQVLVHDTITGDLVDIFLNEEAIYCISVNPEQSEIFSTACENGKVYLYDLRESRADPQVIVSSTNGGAYQSCSFNPRNSNLIATANNESGILLIDLRMDNQTLLNYTIGLDTQQSTKFDQNVMSVKFNQNGTQLTALRVKSPPVLYNLYDKSPICTFNQTGFLNTCTNKSCCFAGDNDQYVCCGSDDFCVYVWKIPNDFDEKSVNQAHLKLKGHRSIVNEVRYNSKFHLLLSSGVEKVIKVWSPYRMPDSIGGLLGHIDEYLPERKRYTDSELFSLRWQNPFQNQLSTNLNDDLEEDVHMIAFFDNLVRREMTNWMDEELPSEEYDDDDDDDDDINDNFINFNNEYNSSSSSNQSNLEDENFMNYEPSIEQIGENLRQIRQIITDEINRLHSEDSFNSNTSSGGSTPRPRELKRCQPCILPSQNDYERVLDSLNVPINTQNLPSNESISSLVIKPSNSVTQETNQVELNQLEKSDNELIVKRLNEQKLRIELDQNFDDTLPTTSNNDSNEDNLNTIFKKSKNYQRNSNKSTINDLTSSSDEDYNDMKIQHKKFKS